MAKNYQDWDIDSLKEEHKKYQRMLIPANIVAIIIAVVAIIGQLFMPMLSVDVTVTGDNFSAVLEYIQDNSEGAAEDDETLQMLEYVSKDVYTKVELNVDPLGALMLGVTPQPQEVRDYIASNADKLEETVDGMLAQMMPRMTVYMVAQATQDQLEDAGINFEELESVDLEQVEAVTESLNNGNYEAAKEQFGTAADSVAEELGYDLTAEDKETIMGYFDEAVEAGKELVEYKIISGRRTWYGWANPLKVPEYQLRRLGISAEDVKWDAAGGEYVVERDGQFYALDEDEDFYELKPLEGNKRNFEERD